MYKYMVAVAWLFLTSHFIMKLNKKVYNIQISIILIDSVIK